MHRNIKSVKRKEERRSMKNAHAGDRSYDGARVRRQHNVCGESTYRKIVCRNLNRRDRRMVNMELHAARYDDSIEIVGRPSANLISASAYITS